MAGTDNHGWSISRTVAAVTLIAFAVFTWWMIRQVGVGDGKWTRLIYVYQGIEAIVFAAAGLLFGTTVARRQVAAADQRAADAEQQQERGAGDAAVGVALEAAVRTAVSESDSAIAASGIPPAESALVGSPAEEAPQPANAPAEFTNFLVGLADQVRSARARTQS